MLSFLIKHEGVAEQRAEGRKTAVHKERLMTLSFFIIIHKNYISRPLFTAVHVMLT